MEPELDATEDIVKFIAEMSEDRAELLKIRCQKAVDKLEDEASEDDRAEVCL